MRSTLYNGVKIGDFNCTDPHVLGDALKGTWQRKWESTLKLTILRGHALLNSAIVTEDTVIKMDLPVHEPFYLNITSATSSRVMLITENINTILYAGEQCMAVFTINEVQ